MLPHVLLQLLSAICGASLYAASAAVSGPGDNPCVRPSEGSGRSRLLAGSLLAALVFYLTSGLISEGLCAPDRLGGPQYALMLLPCLAVASANDLHTLSVPDAVWGAGAIGRLALGLVYGWPSVDILGFGLFCLACLTVVYSPGPPRAGGADIAALVTAALFVGPVLALSIAWASCVIAVASSIGSRARWVPFMPYLLCGTCLVTLGSP
ncbi:MAG: hypothetical protein Q8P50_02570 [Bacillota bacterium]|nr:hypothetical protein [Bacillota bacterium]